MRMANVPSCSLVLRSSASASAASPIVWQPPTQQTGAGHVRGRAWHTASGRNSMGISILCPPHPWAIPAGHEGMRVWSFVRCLIDSEGQAPGTAPSPGLLPPAALWSCSSSPPLPGEIGLPVLYWPRSTKQMINITRHVTTPRCHGNACLRMVKPHNAHSIARMNVELICSSS